MASAAGSVDRRGEILSAAERVFDARGYAAATIDAVAEEAGIAKGSIYNYFKSKQDLFTQVFTESFAVNEAQADRLIGEDLSAGEKLERLLDDWSERMAHYKRIGRLMLECWAVAAREDHVGALAGVFQEAHSRWRQRIGAIVAQGIESGEFSPQIDPSIAASLIMSLGNGLTVQSILDVGVTLDEELLAALKGVVLTSLSAGAGRRDREPWDTPHDGTEAK